MWGLIYKDLIVSKKTLMMTVLPAVGISFVMLFALLAAESSVDAIDDTMVQVVGLAGMIGFLLLLDLPCVFIKNDENRIWSAFVSSSECSVRDQVGSKYVLPFIILVAFINLIYFLYMLFDVIIYKFIGVTGLSSLINTVILLASVILMFWAIEIPFTVYFGSKTGGMIKIAVILVITLGIIIYGLYGREKLSFDKLYELLFSENTSLAVFAATILIDIGSGVLYILSYKLSCRLYLKGAENYE